MKFNPQMQLCNVYNCNKENQNRNSELLHQLKER